MRTQTVSHSVISQSPVLYIAFELSAKTWKLALSDGYQRRPRLANFAAGDFGGVEAEIERARQRLSLPADCPVFTCYEAGRDGFWIHRALERRGIHNVVVDPASIEVNRRFRRAKTDRLDATKLVSMLVRYHRGELRVWSVVRVPGVEDEDFRQLTREHQSLGKEMRQHRMRIQSLLATQGIDVSVNLSLREKLDTLRNNEGEALGRRLKSRIVREFARLELLAEQQKAIRAEQRELEDGCEGERMDKIRRLKSLRGVGQVGGWNLVSELFGWRTFDNRKQVGASIGLSPTPYCSGGMDREQGISKSGNPSLRSLMVELAWAWLRYQPQSALSEWFHQRFPEGSRQRRKGIVALARKLLIVFWRFVEQGVVPDGALLKEKIA